MPQEKETCTNTTGETLSRERVSRWNDSPAGIALTYKAREQQTHQYACDPDLDPPLASAGKVPLIDIELPNGIKSASNFPLHIDCRSVKDEDITHKPERTNQRNNSHKELQHDSKPW